MDIESAAVEPMALFPVFLYEQGCEDLPTEGTYYVVARDGFYVHKETRWGRAVVKIAAIPFLKSLHTAVDLKLPKIPVRIIGQALHFFRKVYNKYKSESYLTLFYSEQQQEYRLWCSKQEVTYGSVRYDRDDQPSFEERNGTIEATAWNMVGTIHSHADFGAFHSGTDRGDEADFDGIHVTLGHVNQPNFSVAASVAVGNDRETLDPVTCIFGIEPVGANYRQRNMGNHDQTRYQLILGEEDAQGLVEDDTVIETTWLPKVHGQEVVRGGWSGRSGFFRGGRFEEENLPSAKERAAAQAVQRSTKKTPQEETTEGMVENEAGSRTLSTDSSENLVELPVDDPGQPLEKLGSRIITILSSYPKGQLVSGAWLRQCLLPDFEAEVIGDLEKVLIDLTDKRLIVCHPEVDKIPILQKYYWLTTATRERLKV